MVQWCQNALFDNNQCHILSHKGEEILSTDQRRSVHILASTVPPYLALDLHHLLCKVLLDHQKQSDLFFIDFSLFLTSFLECANIHYHNSDFWRQRSFTNNWQVN